MVFLKAVIIAMSILLLFCIITGLAVKYNQAQNELMESQDALEKMKGSLLDMNSTLSHQLEKYKETQLQLHDILVTLETANNSLRSCNTSLEACVKEKQLPKECPKGWIFFKNCYTFSNKKDTWKNAKEYCEQKKSHLVVINTGPEQDFLSREMTEPLYWIGLTDQGQEGKWRWVDGTAYDKGPKWGNIRA
ncbi:asialoglycoprotein receptor 1-like [Protopterus annectens]|uniref:asialoglycoprotein receptor 1-like n=1 Tax=Protopterus annectens TaxID=7888 RepID=UPI001CFBE617|nr:asialoglycoprotein receptor 1-like [Protopterus annectens]